MGQQHPWSHRRATIVGAALTAMGVATMGAAAYMTRQAALVPQANPRVGSFDGLGLIGRSEENGTDEIPESPTMKSMKSFMKYSKPYTVGKGADSGRRTRVP